MNATTASNKKNIADEFKVALERIHANPKIIFAIAAAAAISIVVAMLLWARSPDYRLLYSNISDQDAGSVIAQLSQMQVPYRFEEHGGAILVPADQVYEIRLKLAQQGLPKGGAVGFELMDQEKFGISQFSEQVNYQRALEGELSRTIDTLGPVSNARVHLALPKASLFVREQKQPSASVTLTIASGRTLDPNQVNAITYLVSSAVPGLSPSHVTIVDQSGQLLTQSGGQATQASQLKYTSEIESDYQRRILAILAPVVGASNVRAQVTAQLDFTEHEQTSEQYQPNRTPEKMAIRSRQSSSSEQGGRNAVGGVPGALSNQPPAPTTAQIEKPAENAGAADKGQATTSTTATASMPYSQRNDETTNYEVDKTLTHVRKNVGTLMRISAAIVVNYQLNGEGESVGLSKEQLAQINALAKEAIGFSSARGDTLNIVNTPFSTLDDAVTPPLWEQPAFISTLLTGLRYLLVLAIAWVLWRKAVQPFWIKHHEMALQRLELEKEARQAEIDAKTRRAEENLRAKSEQKLQSETNMQKLRELAEHDAQIISLVIRQWINKEQK
ncbi:flagellar basal-body MS-ring/collar protein FliF [Serratia fonticola]|uniref:flagellar basal-body MS-ring/collar protein FliF n=1 Tax=Serratia fonticola TaxID=47917 RepID=UPI00040D2BBA|nr:flagellar basal-body MS-ring/collar protein FliF [Serratia fonticola]